MDTIIDKTQILGTQHSMDITCDFLAFRLDEREFAVPLDKVLELRRGSDVARHDTGGDASIGMLARNSRQIVVFDLHRILTLPSIFPPDAFDVIVINGPDSPYALAVDGVIDVVTLPIDQFMLVTSPYADRNHIWAITMHEERVLRLLDTDGLTPAVEVYEPERLAA